MQNLTSGVGAIIVAAGRSERMGKDKMFMPLANKPLLAWSVDVCQRYSPLDKIVIVLNSNNIEQGKDLVRKQVWSKVVAVCLGGKRRQDSVMEGLGNLDGCDWVIIHDGARPFITIELLNDGLKSAMDTGAAVAAVPVKDTIKLSNSSGIVTETLQRNHLWAIQTPQIFKYKALVEAYEQSDDDVTDDASLIETSGGKVKLYMGSYRNIKITTPEDWELAEVLARGQ